MNIFKLITLGAFCLSLSACGLKGPLTLPESGAEPEQEQVPQPQIQQSETEQS